MKKSLVIAIAVGTVLGLATVGVYTWFNGWIKRDKGNIQVVEEKGKDTETARWDDPAGFSFSYPKDALMDTHPEDKENYAHIDITHPAQLGKITVWAKDTTAADASAWVATDAKLRGASIVDTTLGGQSAKKVLLTTPSAKIIVGAVYDDVLWYIEADPVGGTYWEQVLDAMISSFTFTPIADEPREAGTGTAVFEEEAVDEEEVLE